MQSYSSNSGYDSLFQAARSADLSAVEGRGIIQVIRHDEDDSVVLDDDGNSVILLNLSIIEKSTERWEQSFQLFVRETHEILESPYRLIFITSNLSSELWSVRWLSQKRLLLNERHRSNLKAVTVVHPSFTMRMICAGLYAYHGSEFWQKLHYADRVEELWLDKVLDESKTKQVIPQAVMTYEHYLIAEGEQQREMARQNGAPLAPR